MTSCWRFGGYGSENIPTKRCREERNARLRVHYFLSVSLIL
jgi:hypothetical protein